jgi:hypothetical protein
MAAIISMMMVPAMMMTIMMIGLANPCLYYNLCHCAPKGE